MEQAASAGFQCHAIQIDQNKNPLIDYVHNLGNGLGKYAKTNHKWPNLQRRRDQEPPLLWKHYEKLRIIP